MATKPFFVPQKEIDLIDSMNEELIDNIVGQYVDVYKISVQDTEENMYGESLTKYYDRELQPQSWEESIAPLTAQFFFYPRKLYKNNWCLRIFYFSI